MQESFEDAKETCQATLPGNRSIGDKILGLIWPRSVVVVDSSLSSRR